MRENAFLSLFFSPDYKNFKFLLLTVFFLFFRGEMKMRIRNFRYFLNTGELDPSLTIQSGSQLEKN